MGLQPTRICPCPVWCTRHHPPARRCDASCPGIFQDEGVATAVTAEGLALHPDMGFGPKNLQVPFPPWWSLLLFNTKLSHKLALHVPKLMAELLMCSLQQRLKEETTYNLGKHKVRRHGRKVYTKKLVKHKYNKLCRQGSTEDPRERTASAGACLGLPVQAVCLVSAHKTLRITGGGRPAHGAD